MSKDDKGRGKSDKDSAAPRMPDQAVDAVGRRVKDSYGKLLQEPIPESFLELLDQLDASSSSKRSDSDEGGPEGGRS